MHSGRRPQKAKGHLNDGSHLQNETASYDFIGRNPPARNQSSRPKVSRHDQCQGRRANSAPDWIIVQVVEGAG